MVIGMSALLWLQKPAPVPTLVKPSIAITQTTIPNYESISNQMTAVQTKTVQTWSVSSTSYCQSGTMASGQQTFAGAVAGNIWPLGTRLQILSGEHKGETVTVLDRIGAYSQLDFYTPLCADAWEYGREQITVEEVS